MEEEKAKEKVQRKREREAAKAQNQLLNAEEKASKRRRTN
jgi:hypothetical protein